MQNSSLMLLLNPGRFWGCFVVGEEMDHDAEENEYEDRDSAQVERLLTDIV